MDKEIRHVEEIRGDANSGGTRAVAGVGFERQVTCDEVAAREQQRNQDEAKVEAELSNVIETFRKLDGERCEIVATRSSAWENLPGDDGFPDEELDFLSFWTLDDPGLSPR